MMLALPLFLQLDAACAPSVAPETMAAIVRTESAFDPLAIHDNTTGRALHPATLQDAVATASALISAGHSLDLGLGQINSRVNLASRGIGLAEAFDACTNLRVSAQVLVEGYSACRVGEAQACIREALSRYNTGDAARGFANGSQLYGFVRQSNGVVRLDSVQGQGTVVRLYLPRYQETRRCHEEPVTPSEPNRASAGETVLLVEDEGGVRVLAAEYLRDVGYAVLEVADGSEALRLLRSGARVDVLVTDVQRGVCRRVRPCHPARCRITDDRRACRGRLAFRIGIALGEVSVEADGCFRVLTRARGRYVALVATD